MLLMLSIPLYFSSITTLFVPCFPPAERRKSSLPYSLLSQQDPSSTDVWQENIIDYFARRPVGEPWDSMTLLEFSSWFEVARKAAPNQDMGLPAEHEELQLDQEHETEQADEEGIEESAFEINHQWRESHAQPPFSKKAGEKTRMQPRFTLSGERKGRENAKDTAVHHNTNE